MPTFCVTSKNFFTKKIIGKLFNVFYLVLVYRYNNTRRLVILVKTLKLTLVNIFVLLFASNVRYCYYFQRYGFIYSKSNQVFPNNEKNAVTLDLLLILVYKSRRLNFWNKNLQSLNKYERKLFKFKVKFFIFICLKKNE